MQDRSSWERLSDLLSREARALSGGELRNRLAAPEDTDRLPGGCLLDHLSQMCLGVGEINVSHASLLTILLVTYSTGLPSTPA
jgi:hypothetical protein